MPINYEINVGKIGLESALRQIRKFEKTELKQETARAALTKRDRKKQKEFRSKTKKGKTDFFDNSAFFAEEHKKRKKSGNFLSGKEKTKKIFKAEIPNTFEENFIEEAVKKIIGVGIIARKLSNSGSYKIVIIKDYNKNNGFKFPGGGVEDFDATTKHTASRETEEEIGFSADSKKFNYVGEFSVSKYNGEFAFFQVYTVDIPKNALLIPGEEQEAVYEVYPYQIEEFIKNGIFLKNHAKAWELYKRYIEE